jgi:hypothetical protein
MSFAGKWIELETIMQNNPDAERQLSCFLLQIKKIKKT